MTSKANFIALIVATASFIQQIDATIIATSLPQMSASLHVGVERLGAAMTAYALSLAVFMPVSGWLADRFGPSLVFRAAILVFTIGSVLCGMSDSIVTLTGARFLQGVGGAMMTPVGRLLILRTSEKSQFIVAMAWLQTPAQLGPVIGLPLGGFITTYASWRWNFFINIPIGLAGIVLASIFIQNTPVSRARPFDGVGFVLSGAAILCLVHGLNLLGHDRILWTASSFLAAAGVLGYLGALHSRKYPHPLIDLSMLRIQTFSVNFLAGSLFRYGVNAIPFLLPLLFQLGFGLTAFDSGLLTMASAIGSVTMRVLARPVIQRFGFRRVLIVNGIVSAATIFACVFFSARTPITLIFLTLMIGGFFQALQFVSLNTIAYADVDRERMSSATSLAGMMQQLCNAVAIALAVIFLRIDLLLRGAAAPGAFDFRCALGAMALVSFASVPFFVALPANAGSRFSGRS